MAKGGQTWLESDPYWYKDAIIYEIHVRAFCDGDGDGIGDFPGLTSKLDYLQDLGVTALWLLPFCPSPLRDDGYDIAGYTDIHPSYGKLADFKVFLREAHRRGLRVITELVVNHTSDQHPWFQRARRSKAGSRWRDFYVWSDTPEKYQETRIIFQDFEASNWTWDPVARAYYWHRFYSHQPDLNFDNPQVRKEIFRVLDFWLGLGVDGLRLDAVPYLFEREGTNCENLPETHQLLKKFRAHIEANYRDRMLLAEANQWPEDAVAYFGQGDECHMGFHFPLMPRLFMALRLEDRFPIIDILEQTPALPESAQWAIFLRNHDELTLEMVTDEERDYMYRVYARDQQMRVNQGIRRRLAPLLGNHRRRIELMNGLLLSLPGTPVLYYGDEIGMGDNVFLGDRNGVRTPMQWSADRNAGFSRVNPQRLYLPVIIDSEYHYDAVNVETQQNNPSSLLWWMKRVISLRKRFKALSRGSLEFLTPDNPKILAFIRRHGDEAVLVVVNLSRFVQAVELDLSGQQGLVPVEVFGQTRFPAVGDAPYFLTLGPHDFYWFSLQPGAAVEEALAPASAAREWPLIEAAGGWRRVFENRHRADLEAALPSYLESCRWFRGKARQIKTALVQESIPLSDQALTTFIILVGVAYVEGDPETYVLPLAWAVGERADEISRDQPQAVVARLALKDRDQAGVVYDALVDKSFSRTLLESMARHRQARGRAGELIAEPTRNQRFLLHDLDDLEPRLLKGEQSNSAVLFGERLLLKVFRQLRPGVNPDLEIGRFLTGRGFSNAPKVAAAMEYLRRGDEPATLAVLEEFIPNQGDAWTLTLDALDHFFERVQARRNKLPLNPPPGTPLLELAGEEPPQEVHDLIGPLLDRAGLLGRRTAELHLALASAGGDPDFRPEPFTKLYQRSFYQSLRGLTGTVFRLLGRRRRGLPEAVRLEADKALDLKEDCLRVFHRILEQRLSGRRIRCHGDYHLGQVLFTGKDFVIIDFEGEPTRSIGERRLKRSPLRDVAGMLRSFHYAAHSALFTQQARGVERREDLDFLASWADSWRLWMGAAFFRDYLEAASPGGLLPESGPEIELLLEVFLLEKAVYELGYELNNRPDWVIIPLRSIQILIQAAGEGAQPGPDK